MNYDARSITHKINNNCVNVSGFINERVRNTIALFGTTQNIYGHHKTEVLKWNIRDRLVAFIVLRVTKMQVGNFKSLPGFAGKNYRISKL